MRFRHSIILIPLIAILAAAVVPIFALQVEAVKQNQRLLLRREPPQATFSTRFIHSVEHCPVTEYFRIDARGRIVLYETTFASSNVGLPYRPFGQEVFTVEKDKFRLSNMHRVIPAIILWVNKKYDNTLTIGNEHVPLFDLAGNTLLKISVERLSLLHYLWVKTEILFGL